jgi:NAD(P)-dependent dehydrogenase (short-subunit alcohol dehydrogenase family)
METTMDLELKGKVAIVTGGNRGIGKAIARELAKEGANVAVIGRNRGALDEVAAQIARESGAKALGFIADTNDDAAVKRMVVDVAGAFGRIDILVNCAAKPSGQAKPPTLSELTSEELWDHVNTKVMGYIRTARGVAPYMVKQGGGRIINISGLGARHTGTTIGSIRNVGVVALTKSLADELGPQGIQAICVHPGLTRTEATAGVVARAAKAQGISEADVEKSMAGRNLVRKLITSEEIAHVVAFLASPKAMAINGDAIPAGGGSPGSIYY